MKKGLLVAVIAVLLLFCLLAVLVGGFFGYRWYKGRAAAEEARMEEPAPSLPPLEESRPEEPSSPSEERAEPPAPEPQEGLQEEPAPAPKAPSAEAPARPRPRPLPAEAPPPPAPAPEPEAAPHHPPAVEPAPTAEPAPPPPAAPKVPKGTLGLIFEGKIDEGQVTLTVDGEVWASEPFTASSERRFRLEKSKNLLPGPHEVKVSVSTPGGKTYEKQWTATVAARQSTVWKAEMNRFPKALEVKPIAQ